MHALLYVISLALELYMWVIIIVAIMSWLIAFNVINVYNSVVRSVWDGLNGLTEPVLRRVRSWLPSTGGIDISPVIVILLIVFIQMVIRNNIDPYMPF